MEVLRQRIAEFDRREFVKLTGAAGIFALVAKDALGAECPKETKIGTGLQFWLDGLHLEGSDPLTDPISNATLALYSYDHNMSPTSYVESVTLIDSVSGSALAVKYFRASDKTSTGKTPYVIFENLTLKYAGRYLVIYTVKSGEKLILHTYDLAKASRSTFGQSQVRIPLGVKNKMGASGGMALLKDTYPDYVGTLTTPYVYYTQNGLGAHAAKSVIQSISADGKFSIVIDAMHSDVNAGHFMRYFLVADPVGRLLGLVERTFVAGGAVPSQTVQELASDTALITRLQTEAPGDTWTASDIANINDCPYIQIITEDAYDAIARQVVRLR